jgi:hypothetical protein
MTTEKPKCDCGCNTPVASKPLAMLRFLSGRFKHAGVAEAVASIYARDIDLILKEFDATTHESEKEDITPQDLIDAKRYRFLQEQGAMWFTGKHAWRSSHRLDIEIDKAMREHECASRSAATPSNNHRQDEKKKS